jgi:hypothetical protein
MKLVAIRLWSEAEAEDYEDMVTVALRDIDRLIGSKFAARLKDPDLDVYTSAGEDDDAEDDERE